MIRINNCVRNFRTFQNARLTRSIIAAGIALFILTVSPSFAGVVQGQLVRWHPVEVHFSGGSNFCETSSEATDGKRNPFLDRRLNVTFTHLDAQSQATHSLVVPGFYAGDGAGGSCGNTWVVRFTPDSEGTWVYTASFRQGTNINLSLNPTSGTSLLFDGESDVFTVAPTDYSAPGFLSRGMLRYTGKHYLRHAGGGFFIKGGTDSPENLFGADAFDDTFDQFGGVDTTGLTNGIHSYPSHVADFGPAGLGSASDPFWTSNIGGDSRGVIGLLNYLGSRNVNSIYFLPMNLGGDGRDTYPFVSPNGSNFSNTHYDISKLYQWNMTLNHAQRQGIMWNCVLGETETGNEQWFGPTPNVLTDQRKLFYREMVARFGYLNGIKWNIGEETDQTVDALSNFATYIGELDPFDHPICFHTNSLPSDGSYPKYKKVLGRPQFSACSLQHAPNVAGSHVEKWRTDSALSGRKWVVDSDEQLTGLSSANQEFLRKATLYDVLFSGGNIEWYFGAFPFPDGNDLTAEDMRTRSAMWDYTWYARKFLLENVAFHKMQPADHVVTGESNDFGGAEVLAWEGDSYAIYWPSAAKTGSIDLPNGTYTFQWYNPRTGTFVGNAVPFVGSSSTPIERAPSPASEDWVALIRRVLSPNELSLTRFYPGLANTLNDAQIAGAMPSSPILVYFSVLGTTSVPLQNCPSVSFNLREEMLGAVLLANKVGEKVMSVDIMSGPPLGTTVYLQAIAPFECSVSNVTTFTW